MTWVGSATSQFRNTLHLIWYRCVSVYGIHSELGFTVFRLFLKWLSFQILVNALCYTDRVGFFWVGLVGWLVGLVWFFFSWNLLSLNLHTSVLPIFMVLQNSHLYSICRCSYCISSPEVLKLGVAIQGDVLQDTNLQGVWVSQFRFFWL